MQGIKVVIDERMKVYQKLKSDWESIHGKYISPDKLKSGKNSNKWNIFINSKQDRKAIAYVTFHNKK